MRFSPFFRLGATCLTLMVSLGGCAFLIPEDPSAPRYNSVTGERHRPQLNSMTPQGSAAPMPGPGYSQSSPMAPQAMSAPVPTAPVTAAAPSGAAAMASGSSGADYPPVDPSVQARANQQMASAGLPPFMSQDPAQAAGRHAPVENNVGARPGEIRVSENTYPSLNSVPPRPPMTGDDNPTSHLSKVRGDLERDRESGNAVRDQLNRDAAQEPSLLNDPTAVPTQMRAPGSSLNDYNPRGNAYNGGLEPINLRAPVSSGPTTRIVQAPPATLAMAPAAKGGFNPMADAPLTDGGVAVTYVSEGYLPSSRYAAQRQ